MTTDFFPTILDLAAKGPEAPATPPGRPSLPLDGVSILPLLGGGTKLERDALYWHYPHYSNQGGFPGGAIRVGDWKLVERYEDGQVQLYNLEDDLGERHDLAAANAERVTTMRARLHRWYKDVDAKFLRAKKNQAQKPWRP